jgi:hypothetical protein
MICISIEGANIFITASGKSPKHCEGDFLKMGGEKEEARDKDGWDGAGDSEARDGADNSEAQDEARDGAGDSDGDDTVEGEGVEGEGVEGKGVEGMSVGEDTIQQKKDIKKRGSMIYLLVRK